jgi:hypothetical protein
LSDGRDIQIADLTARCVRAEGDYWEVKRLLATGEKSHAATVVRLNWELQEAKRALDRMFSRNTGLSLEIAGLRQRAALQAETIAEVLQAVRESGGTFIVKPPNEIGR